MGPSKRDTMSVGGFFQLLLRLGDAFDGERRGNEDVVAVSTGEGNSELFGESDDADDTDEEEDDVVEEDNDERVVVPVGLSVYFPSICYSRESVSNRFGVDRARRICGKRHTAAEVAFSWLDFPVTLKATPLGAVSLNSKVVAERW